jgi:hypothetical protein
MFKKDLDKVKELHEKYQFKSPLIDAGGLSNPTVADYSISAAKAFSIHMEDGRVVKVPHPEQDDRYLNISRPWSFIDPAYKIENPEEGGVFIEQLPHRYPEFFNTVIMVSVMEHVKNPFEISDCIYQILKPGGFLFNSTPFIFPHHPSPEDNYRFSPQGLKYVHESSGFEILEGGFHLKINAGDGVGDTNPQRYGQPQAIWASFCLCRKNEGSPK